MASILLQERMVGATLGLALGLGATIYERRLLWHSTQELAYTLSGGTLSPIPPVQAPNLLFSRHTREEMAHSWNIGVEKLFRSIISSVSSKGW